MIQFHSVILLLEAHSQLPSLQQVVALLPAHQRLVARFTSRPKSLQGQR